MLVVSFRYQRVTLLKLSTVIKIAIFIFDSDVRKSC